MAAYEDEGDVIVGAAANLFRSEKLLKFPTLFFPRGFFGIYIGKEGFEERLVRDLLGHLKS
ncbi:MAG: hypothetical protein QXH08_06290 [Candidatus Hadarchaeales archaeon]